MNSRLVRLLFAMPLLASVALLTPASARAPAALQLCGNSASPSKLDYLVLASLADSSNWLALSAYSAAPKQISAGSGQRCRVSHYLPRVDSSQPPTLDRMG
jgi:hypothetical protein